MPFKVGDVVVRVNRGRSVAGGETTSLDAELKGRVCKVITSGISYKVRYDGLNFCLLQFEDSLAKSSGAAPACTGPTCT